MRRLVLVASILTAAVLIALPSIAGAIVVHKAPYRGLRSNLYGYSSPATACQSTNLVHGATNTTTGIGGYDSAMNVSSCVPITGGTVGGTLLQKDVLSLWLPASKSGPGTYSVTFHASYNKLLNISSGICISLPNKSHPSCTETAKSGLYTTAQVTLATGGNGGPLIGPVRSWSSGNLSYRNVTACTSGGCKSVVTSTALSDFGNMTLTWKWQANFTKGMGYRLTLTIYAFLETEIDEINTGMSGVNIGAALNSADGGDYLQLVSVSLP